jgi:hypothetical protein
MLTWRLGREIPARAQELAATLPEDVRGAFVGAVSRMSAADLSGGGRGEIPLPPDTPPEVAGQLRELVVRSVHEGFATAVAQTLLLGVAAFALALLATLAMHAVHTHAGVPDERTRVPAGAPEG